ncbi:MAG: family of calcium-binding protein, partial [Verrucomicrobiales bacterium]|nr:family of calcium-binding protein [Verrucomicrobiales bacterium]
MLHPVRHLALRALLTAAAAGLTLSANADPLVLRHRWLFDEAASSTSFADSLSPADNARAILLRGTGATVAGDGKVLLPGGSSTTAPYLDLPNGMVSARTSDATYEGWVSISGTQSNARIFDFGSSSMGETSAPGGTGTAVESLSLYSQLGLTQTTHRVSLLESGVLAQGDAGVTYTAGQSFHFALVYDADGNNGLPQLRYYKNGVLGVTVNSVRLIKNVIDDNCWIGRSNATADNNFQGGIGEFRVWDGAMLADEVAESKTAGDAGQLANALHIDTFAPGATSLASGNSTTLTWAITNPGGTLTASINNGIGALSTASGSMTVTPLTTTTYTLTCGNGAATRTASFTITVTPAVITANHAELRTTMQSDLAIVLPATSVPAVPLSYTILRQPAHGQLLGTAPNLTYRPDTGYLGRDNFSYSVTGGSVTSKVGGISIEVTPDVPTTSALTVSIPHNTATAVTLPAVDPDNETLTYSILTPPLSGTLTGTGATRTYTPAAGYTGTQTFTFKANDGTYDSAPATVTLTILPPPTAPVGVVLSDSKVLTSDVPGSFLARLQANDPNPSDTHTFQLAAGAGDTDNNKVEIIGNQLRATSSFAGSLGQLIQIRIQVTDSSGRSTFQQVVLPVQDPVRNIVINEIHYNPARNEIPAEFVELYNPLPATVDLGGWKLGGGVTYTFPAGTTIAPGAYLVIAEDPATMQGMYGVSALGPWTGSLNADGEDVQLLSTANAVVDTVVYGVVSPWPAGCNGNGPSMELIHPLLNNELGSNWK